MAEPPSQSPAQTPPPPPPPPQQAPAADARDDMMACVAALEAALLPCLPARELQAVDRSLQSSHQIDVERHARDFMEAAKKLQSYFISLQREDRSTREEMLRKVVGGTRLGKDRVAMWQGSEILLQWRRS
ncbi:hypothetical protein ABZP36_030149 [Zizania latifolia]